MKDQRSTTQILFGYLPEQTVDLRGRVWKVNQWVKPQPLKVDGDALRRELLRQVAPWTANDNDGGFANALHGGRDVEAVELTPAGVLVEAYPKLFLCKACKRLTDTDTRPCRCGENRWGPFHFVAYHDCGRVEEPRIASCPQHGQRRVRFPGTASATEIVVDCPDCGRELQRGLNPNNRPRRCDCGNGNMSFTVHRAASVYTPRSVVIVNPPTNELMRRLNQAGGAARALEWVTSGMTTKSFADRPMTSQALLEQLLDNMPREAAEALVRSAEQRGDVAPTNAGGSVPDVHEDARAEAVSVATALADSRLTIGDITNRAEPGSSRRVKYEDYPTACADAGLQGVEFLERFPVMTGMYGYTRGDLSPGGSTLVPFRRKDGTFQVHADLQQTEALFFRLDPLRVVEWLSRNGHDLGNPTDSIRARRAVLEGVAVPVPGEDPPATPTAGSLLLTLVHSYAHRVVRLAATLAGNDRNGLSEYLVPWHMGFFVFAAARGGFVLGGLRAMFEGDLDRLLHEVVVAERRCALDPGCAKNGRACVACLHLGEPSCRWFNRFLDRDVLLGPLGYLVPEEG